MKSYREFVADVERSSGGSIDEMFGIPNKVAGMWMVAMLVGGVLQVYFSKDKKNLASAEHQAFVQGTPSGWTMKHLGKDAKPEEVIHDLRVAYRPSKIEIEVV